MSLKSVMRNTSSPGFSLIEVMAAVLLTSIVIGVALSFQINLGSATERARERLRTQRQALALLDRISHDISGAYFIAPSKNTKPEASPWVFVTAREFSDEGKADAIKFITRNYEPIGLDTHSSDLAVVAYYLNQVEDRPGYQLLRWRKTHMPTVFDPSFPAVDDPHADIIGEDIATFEISMVNNNGAEMESWNSGGLPGNQALPRAVKIEISMIDANAANREEATDDFDDARDDFNEDGSLDEDVAVEAGHGDKFSKLVIIPLRPLDWTFLEAQARVEDGADLDDDAYADNENDDEDDFFDDDDDDDRDEDFDDESDQDEGGFFE
jgi:prepilin-type N-terminal cleavage/methylation domain-containing protein